MKKYRSTNTGFSPGPTGYNERIIWRILGLETSRPKLREPVLSLYAKHWSPLLEPESFGVKEWTFHPYCEWRGHRNSYVHSDPGLYIIPTLCVIGSNNHRCYNNTRVITRENDNHLLRDWRVINGVLKKSSIMIQGDKRDWTTKGVKSNNSSGKSHRIYSKIRWSLRPRQKKT